MVGTDRTITATNEPDAVNWLMRHDDTALAIFNREDAAAAMAELFATGDLSKLSNAQRVGYYLDLCRSLGLNPRSRPFDWLILDNRLVLYPNKSCAEQLRAAHQISVKVLRREPIGDLFVVEVEGRTPQGRTDQSSKYVPLTKWDRQSGRHVRLNSAELSNAYAKAETGAKRRLAFSMVGLAALPDPDELRHGRVVVVDGGGNVIERPSDEQQALADDPDMARMLGEPTYEDAPSEPVLPADLPNQAPTPASLTQTKRTVPRQSFRPSEDDVRRWCGAWFAIVKGTGLDADDARHAYVRAWTETLGWPERKRTQSLRTMFARMTEDEAQSFLAHVRAQVDYERGAYAVGPTEPEDDGEPIEEGDR